MKILIVENDTRLATNLKKNFERENFTAEIIEQGKTAEKRLFGFSSHYDLMLLDLTLPDTSGIDVCKNLRQQGIKIPIIVISGQDSIEERIRALDNGADDYVIEPFAIGELLARVRAVLRRPNESIPIVMKIGSLEFHPGSRRIYREGKEIILTPKEFAIFEYLIRHPNQVVSRDQILDNAWAFDFNSLSNVIDVHVKNLRKKISESKNDNIIETIWGVGYKFNKLPEQEKEEATQSMNNNVTA